MIGFTDVSDLLALPGVKTRKKRRKDRQKGGERTMGIIKTFVERGR